MACWFVLALLLADVEIPYFYIQKQIYYYNGGGTLVQTIVNVPDVYVYHVETAYVSWLFMGVGLVQMIYGVALVLQHLAEPVEEGEE